MGSASVTHQVIINPATASTFRAPGSTLKGLTNQSRKAMATPASNEMILIFGWEIDDKLCSFYFQDTMLAAKKSLMPKKVTLSFYVSLR